MSENVKIKENTFLLLPKSSERGKENFGRNELRYINNIAIYIIKSHIKFALIKATKNQVL